MEHDSNSIRCQSEKHERLFSLMHRVDGAALLIAHEGMPARKAVGVDGIRKEDYEAKATENVLGLVERLKSFKYVPQPVRRVYIPKANGKQRPLGIPSCEDRFVQKVMADIHTEVYEPRFLDCSYGFRPNRGAHDVVRYIHDAVMCGKVNYVLEADIKGFFANVDQTWLVRFLEHDIGDRNYGLRNALRPGVAERSTTLDLPMTSRFYLRKKGKRWRSWRHSEIASASSVLNWPRTRHEYSHSGVDASRKNPSPSLGLLSTTPARVKDATE